MNNLIRARRSNQQSPSWRDRLAKGWLILMSLAAAAVLLKPTAQPSAATPVSEVAAPTAPALQTRKIEDIRVGDRVRVHNPTGEQDLSLGTDIEPRTWRRIELRAPKVDGSWADIVLLRPLSWLQGEHAEVGGTVFISVPECGIDGHAEVFAINPCPPIKPGKGRIVTGTYRHSSAKIVDLHTAGQKGAIGTTANHRFWSMERQAFVAASELQVGENLQTVAGMTQVMSVTPRREVEAVYNLEVQVDHVYFVSSRGILCHNNTPDPNCNYPKPPTGRGAVPPDQRDPKRVWTKTENEARLVAQDGQCASCGQPITIDNGRGHHRTRHADGGRTDGVNHDVLCVDCHKEVHRP